MKTTDFGNYFYVDDKGDIELEINVMDETGYPDVHTTYLSKQDIKNMLESIEACEREEEND